MRSSALVKSIEIKDPVALSGELPFGAAVNNSLISPILQFKFDRESESLSEIGLVCDSCYRDAVSSAAALDGSSLTPSFKRKCNMYDPSVLTG